MYHAIKHLFPGIGDHEFFLQDDGQGPYIARWDRPESQPTPEQIQQAIAVLPPPWRDLVIEEFKAEREKLLNRIAGIAGRKNRQGDVGFADALDWMAEQIIPLDTHPLVQAATNAEEMRAAFVHAYRQVAAGALAMAPSTEVQQAWKVEVDKVFK